MTTFVLVHGSWHDGSAWRRVIKHLVMWDVLGRSDGEKASNIGRLRAAFEGLRGKIGQRLR